MIARLRSALTPQTLMVLALLLMIGSMVFSCGDKETALEERIEHTLSTVKGAGEVHVVITTKAMPQSSSGLAASQEPQQIPCGVIAVAQGASDPLVCMELTQALSTLLGLPPASVSVLSGRE